MKLQANNTFDNEQHTFDYYETEILKQTKVTPSYLSKKNNNNSEIVKRLLINFKKLQDFMYIYNTLKGRGHKLSIKYGNYYAFNKQQHKEIFIKTNKTETIEKINFLLTIKNPKKWLINN